MSSDDSDDGGPGEREVAHRLFAAEFEDASFEYSESDEERAPNYVVTPTGARVNRMFVGGVLTEVEAVNEDTLRGRVVDPTGAFVTYAGQYQPDEVAFLDRTTPPEFVALTGKARTFQPDDSDVVYTSVRPESLNEVDDDTRDRWVVTAAEATLHRVAVTAEALSMDERGDDLREQLLDSGVDSSLAAGVPLALDHYETTESYLETVRTMAVQALEVVADERDEVEAVTTDPAADDDTALGALPAGVGLDGDPTGSSDEADETDEQTPAVGGADDDTDEATESAPTTTPAETTGTEATGAGVTGSDEAGSATTPTETTGGETATEATAADSTETTVDSSADAPDDDLGSFDDGGLGSFDDEKEESGTADAPADAAAATDDTADTTADDTTTDDTTTDDTTTDDTTTDDTMTDDFDPESVDEGDLDDALTEEEREEVMEQHDVGFSTGSEVPNPEESDLDAPDPEEISTEGVVDDPDAVAASEAGAGESPGGSVGDAPGSSFDEQEPTGSAETADDGASSEAAGAVSDDSEPADPAIDVDLTTAVVNVMEELNEGDGVEQEQVLAATVNRHGADPGAVEDAIQDALMNGQCYEAGGGLKPI